MKINFADAALGFMLALILVIITLGIIEKAESKDDDIIRSEPKMQSFSSLGDRLVSNKAIYFDIELADFDGDGDMDIVVKDAMSIYFIENKMPKKQPNK